ncbi:unnamed protein product [Cuscuta europaea]|uniref:Uncharacterized protein n=1 Tax=Cuscuta europaea TaxID=41803 RepID=A0A9P1EA15_CUSEU|nr:unnamed protein product [Cuscuta europaea]
MSWCILRSSKKNNNLGEFSFDRLGLTLLISSNLVSTIIVSSSGSVSMAAVNYVIFSSLHRRRPPLICYERGRKPSPSPVKPPLPAWRPQIDTKTNPRKKKKMPPYWEATIFEREKIVNGPSDFVALVSRKYHFPFKVESNLIIHMDHHMAAPNAIYPLTSWLPSILLI